MPDGTYQGSGTGFGGTVTVSVTIREKTITAVDILSHSDTPSFFSRAEARVVAAILAEQKADVDAVSGRRSAPPASGMPRRKPSPALLREVAHGK